MLEGNHAREGAEVHITKLPLGSERALIICYCSCSTLFSSVGPYISNSFLFYTSVCLSLACPATSYAYLSGGYRVLPSSIFSFFLVCWSVGSLFKTSSILLVAVAHERIKNRPFFLLLERREMPTPFPPYREISRGAVALVTQHQNPGASHLPNERTKRQKNIETRQAGMIGNGA